MTAKPARRTVLSGVLLALAFPTVAGAAQVPSAVIAPASPSPPTAASQEPPRDVLPVSGLLVGAPRTTLRSGPLRVSIALPDAKRGFYRGTRFDWSGMIVAVTLGKTQFYGLWADGLAANVRDFVDNSEGVVAGPRNTATGPAEEFANRDGETVPGYNTAPPGGTFIKIGVGRLRKDDARPYDHFSAYTIVDGGTWTIERRTDRIRFVQRLAPDPGGYGYEYEKTVSLAPGGMMTIAHRLRNTGSKPIKTQVYNHNFARFDGAEIGPGVSVRFPFALTGPASNPGLATISGSELRYDRPLQPGDRVQLPAQPGDPTAPTGAFRVTGANGATITMQADVPLVRTVLWSIRRTVAVEPFIAIDVPPGGEQRWSWVYTYTGARR